MSNGCGNLLKKRQARRYQWRKFLIGSRSALDFGSRMTFPAATAEKERLKTRATISISSRKYLDFGTINLSAATTAEAHDLRDR